MCAEVGSVNVGKPAKCNHLLLLEQTAAARVNLRVRNTNIRDGSRKQKQGLGNKQEEASPFFLQPPSLAPATDRV